MKEGTAAQNLWQRGKPLTYNEVTWKDQKRRLKKND
jgi:hypothetical protein